MGRTAKRPGEIKPAGKVIVAQKSRRRIEEDQPEVVIAAIREVFSKVHK